MLVDAHIHLYSEIYAKELRTVLLKAKEDDVAAVVCASEDFGSSLKTLEISRTYPHFVYAALGIHPSRAAAEDAHRVADLISSKRGALVAVGEVGVDKKYADFGAPMDAQLATFRCMLEAAEAQNLPVVVHSGRSPSIALEELSRFSPRGVLLHWFVGDESLVKEAIDRGYYFSFPPSIIYSKRLKRLASLVPVERLLTETDGPVKFRGPLAGALTLPSHVKLVAQELAVIKGLDIAELVKVIFDNFASLFNVRPVGRSG